MPGLNGWDFMDRYRVLDDKYKAHVVIIMLTTSLNPEDEQRALNDNNITTFLHKPLRPEIIQQLADTYFNPAD